MNATITYEVKNADEYDHSNGKYTCWVLQRVTTYTGVQGERVTAARFTTESEARLFEVYLKDLDRRANPQSYSAYDR